MTDPETFLRTYCRTEFHLTEDPKLSDHIMNDLGADSQDILGMQAALAKNGIDISIEELSDGLQERLPPLPSEHKASSPRSINFYDVVLREKEAQTVGLVPAVTPDYENTVPMTFGRLVQIARRKFRMSMSAAWRE